MTWAKMFFNMKRNRYLLYFLLSLFFGGTKLSAQENLHDSIPRNQEHILVSYLLDIKSDKKNGHAESYNGAVKTIFLDKEKARSRMVSLMRVQSIFYNAGAGETITVVKESGKEKYKKNFSSSAWQQLNNKYKDAVYTFENDSLQVLDYMCKKAIVQLKDGKKIIAYYAPMLHHNSFAKVEPAFAGIPGIVLKYEYKNKNASFVYTATDISFAITGPEIYRIP